jgi:maltose-binding protein MalE
MDSLMQTSIDDPAVDECTEQARKPYIAPQLTDFGSVAELTKGAIGAGGDIGIYS